MPATTFKIFRYQPDAARPESFYQDFQLEHEGQKTLLDAMLDIQNDARWLAGRAIFLPQRDLRLVRVQGRRANSALMHAAG